MLNPLRHLRRGITQLAIGQAITASALLPIGVQRSVASLLVSFAGSIPMLRARVRENMCLALGDSVPARAESLYFRRLSWLLSRSLATFHHGIAATSLSEEIDFDVSVRVLDEAVSEGRGVVLAAPHWFGHELTAALINRRHSMAMLVRGAATPARMARKLRWYEALGTQTVLRPSQASAIKDAAAYLRILSSGKILAITPDLLAGGDTVSIRASSGAGRESPQGRSLLQSRRRHR